MNIQRLKVALREEGLLGKEASTREVLSWADVIVPRASNPKAALAVLESFFSDAVEENIWDKDFDGFKTVSKNDETAMFGGSTGDSRDPQNHWDEEFGVEVPATFEISAGGQFKWSHFLRLAKYHKMEFDNLLAACDNRQFSSWASGIVRQKMERFLQPDTWNKDSTWQENLVEDLGGDIESYGGGEIEVKKGFFLVDKIINSQFKAEVKPRGLTMAFKLIGTLDIDWDKSDTSAMEPDY